METQTLPAENEPDTAQRSDVDKIKRLIALKHIAHEGMMLDKMAKEIKLVHDLAVQTRDGTLGTAGQTEAFPDEGGDMGVSIGNEIKNTFYVDGGKETDKETQSTPIQTIGKTAKDWLIPGLVGAAIPIAGSLGLGTAFALYKAATNESTSVSSPIQQSPPAPVLKAGSELGLRVSDKPQ